MEHIFHPIPDLANVPEPATKSEQLEIIVANLDAQRNTVRSRIISAAQDELKTLLAAADKNYATTTATTANASPIQSPLSADDTPNPGLAHFIASMGSSTGSPAAHLSPIDTQSPAKTKNIPQAPVPLELQVALRTTQQLDEYDANFSKLRAKYANALERERQIGAGVDDRRQSTAAGLGAERRRSSFATKASRDSWLSTPAAAAGVVAAPAAAPPNNAMNVDVDVDCERDPWRRRSSATAFEPPPSYFDHKAHEIDAQRDPRRR